MSEHEYSSVKSLTDTLHALAKADQVRDSERICDLIRMCLSAFLSERPINTVVLQTILQAALELGQLDLIARIADELDKDYRALPLSRPMTSLLAHTAIIYKASKGTIMRYVVPPENSWNNALSATNEGQFLRALDQMLRPQRDLSEIGIFRLVALAALAKALGWSAGWRHAQRLLVIGTPNTGIQSLETAWQAFGFSAESQMSIISHVESKIDGNMAQNEWEAVLTDFVHRRDLPSALKVWRVAEQQSRLATLLGGTPLSSVARATLAQRIAATSSDKDAPVWVYMTWREGADRLLGLAASYFDTNARLIVSIGGDGRPADLTLASTILLADQAHMISRPVVTWGGPKLFFHNLLPVIEAFRNRTTGKAWFAVVCDRSFPLHGLRRFAQRLDDWRVMTRSGPLDAPHSWHEEWDEATVENLPTLIDGALAELFECGSAHKLIELVGPKSRYFPKDDFRLNQCHINFSASARAINGDHRFAAQTYAVSPYAADFRWMSLARLSEFVDTGTEGGPTYTRPHHPWSVNWIHSVLKNQSMRVGDPFFVAEHKYAEQLMTDPERFTLFTAMNSGLGPEMNFFDTYAWSKGLTSHFHHLFSRQPVEIVDSEFFDQVLDDADASGIQFIRKAIADPRDELLNFLARRIIDDSGWSTFYWAVPGERGDLETQGSLPMLDSTIMESLIGIPLTIRDMLDRDRRPARLDASGEVTGAEGRIGVWSYDNGCLVIRFNDTRLQEKCYQSMGADADHLTLVPDEVVDVYNVWSAFLEFKLVDLKEVDRTVAKLDVAKVLLDRELLWIGSPKQDSNMIAAFADLEHSTPTPTFRHTGHAIDIRVGGGKMLVLASIAGQPALLRLHGAAHAAERTVALLSVSNDEDLAAWPTMLSSRPIFELQSSDIPGRWILETFEEGRPIRLASSGTVTNDQGDLLGHWRTRERGIQLFGLSHLRVAITTQARFRDGCWRLSGWAGRNMREFQSFSLTQIPV